MNSDALDKVTRAYHRPNGIRESLPETLYVQETWVQEYHQVLDNLKDVLDVEEFRIPDEHLTHLDQNPRGADIIAGYRGEDYIPDLTEDRYIGRRTFRMRLDAVISYLSELREPSG